MTYRDYHLNFVVVAESIDEAVDILDNTPYEKKLQYIIDSQKELNKWVIFTNMKVLTQSKQETN